jgi:DNA replication and repair protein RecF
VTLEVLSLEVRNFRNLEDRAIPFQSGINWLKGDNGQGKTSCLEAIYFALTTKSFRTHRLNDLLYDRKLPAAISVKVQKQVGYQTFACDIDQGKVKRSIGDKPCQSMDLFKAVSCMEFTARSKLLVEGYPDDRRRFLDRMICVLDPQFIYTLGKYNRTQSQLRKLLLQKDTSLPLYRSFKQTLVALAVGIVKKRLEFIATIRERAIALNRDVFQNEGELAFEYQIKSGSSLEDYEQRYLDLSAQELMNGKSLIGPHLDEISFAFKNKKAKVMASSGQVRAIVFCFQLAVREAYFSRNKQWPILLLDDIDAELDSLRLNSLLDHLSGFGQILITTSKYGTMQGRMNDYILDVNAGCINPERNDK